MRIVLSWLCWLLPWWASAQNLVPNPDFEQVIKPACLYLRYGDNISRYVTDWYAPTGGTPDVWSNDPLLPTTCAQLLTPIRMAPHSGRECAGLYTYTFAQVPYREYIQVKLKQTMRRGQTYHVEMYVAQLNNLHVPTTDPGRIKGNSISNNMGMYFSADSLVVEEKSPFHYGLVLNAKPQINDANLPDETNTWYKIDRCFVADQDYNYLTIGNFFDDKQTIVYPIESGYTDQRAYFLVDDVSVELVPTPPALVNLGRDTTVCYGQTVTLALADTANTTYRWQDGSTRPRYTARTTGVYQVTATRGNCSFSDTINISVQPTIKLPNDTTLCRGEELLLDATNALNTYAWSTGETTAKIRVSSAGTYAVRIPSAYCTITDTVRVAVADCPGMVPNVFTPNGDGKNDVFFIPNIELLAWKLAVFNRWGQQVYQSNAYANDWNGSDLPAGLYYYLLQNSELKRELKGWLEILK